MSRLAWRQVRAFERWLLADGPAHRLAALRIAVGCFGIGWLLVSAPGLVDLGRLDPVRFAPVGVVSLLGLGPPSASWLAACVAVTSAAGVAFTTGWRYRLTAPVFGAGLLLVTTYQSCWGKLLHTENLLVVHVLVLAISPAADALSVDRAHGRRTGGGHGWPVRVLALATVGAYLAAGVTKLRSSGVEWIDPENLRNWVAYDLVRKELFDDPYLPIAVPALEHAWVFAPAAVLTLLVELGAPLALRSAGLARAWAAATWTLHLAVLAVMSVAFPYQLSGIPLVTVLLASGAAGSKVTPAQPVRAVEEPAAHHPAT